MQPKENFLEAIKFGKPQYVPMSCEDIIINFGYEDMLKFATWTDRWGVGWKFSMEGTTPHPKINPLADIRNLSSYKFPDPFGLVLSEKSIYEMKQVDRSQKLIQGTLYYLLFERVCTLMGMDNFIMAIYDFPDEVHFLLHKIADYARKAFDRYLELGVDVIEFSEDLGSQRALMISPTVFREFLLPEYKYIFENVIKEKKIVNFHSCGCVDEIAYDLASIGVHMLNPIQARANDIIKLKRDTMGKMALRGGIDSHLLLKGTPEQVKHETIRILEILKPNGGYVCGPDQYFPEFPIENMNAMWSVAREYGRY